MKNIPSLGRILISYGVLCSIDCVNPWCHLYLCLGNTASALNSRFQVAHTESKVS